MVPLHFPLANVDWSGACMGLPHGVQCSADEVRDSKHFLSKSFWSPKADFWNPWIKSLDINESLIGSSNAFSAAFSVILSILVAYLSGKVPPFPPLILLLRSFLLEIWTATAIHCSLCYLDPSRTSLTHFIEFGFSSSNVSTTFTFCRRCRLGHYHDFGWNTPSRLHDGNIS